MTTEPTKTIELTKGEATALLQLIDAAVKTLGLNAAEAGFVLAKKINSAFAETASPVIPETQA